MMVNTNTIVSSNDFSGFGNYSSVYGTNSLDAYLGLSPGTSVVISAGDYAGPIRITSPLNNANAVTEVQIAYTPMDSFTRILPGNVTVNYPNSTLPQYQIESFSYFTGGNLVIDTYVINQTAGNVTVPPIVINTRAFLFVAPF